MGRLGLGVGIAGRAARKAGSVVPANVTFTPSTTQPGNLIPGFVASFSTSMDFLAGVAYVYHFKTSGTTANVTCTIGGVSASVVGGNANGTETVFAAVVAAAGSKTVTFTANDANVFNNSTVGGGTAVGGQTTPSSAQFNATAFVSLPFAGTALTVLTNGLGLFFMYDEPGDAVLSGVSQVKTSGFLKIATSAASATPSFASGTNGPHGIISVAAQK